ncbi:MAG: hypothetical protein ACSLFM_03335 [Tepidiformaceae bacterium]
MDATLEWQNRLVLAVVQALVGAISEAIRAVAISTDIDEQSLDVYFAMRDPGQADIDLTDEIITDISALTSGEILVRPHIWTGDEWTAGWPGGSQRLVFAAMPRDD